MSGSGEALSKEAVAELRHDLRTPVNHILGYCEMLLDDVTETEASDRRVALENTIATARDVLELIGNGLPAAASELTRRDIANLYESLREPQRRIVGILTSLLEITPEDPDFLEDVRKVIRSAEKLVPAPPEAATGRPAGAAVDSAPSGSPASGRPAVEASDVGASEGANKGRILVVDDNPDNREILQRRLERQGYSVESAENGVRALRLLKERPFDLVLLDIMMPEVDGYEVLRQVKEDPRTRNVPVIMISALDDMGSIVRCIERGAEDYLPKPFDPVLLRARISASLDKKRLRDQEIEYLEQVNRVIEAASAVEAGSYEAGTLAAIASRGDELGRLARVFDDMAGEVKAREERLRKQVGDLKLAIEAAQQASAPQSEPRFDAELEVGQRFAERYEIVRAIDRGGMGMVYKARDRELDDDIAIKILHSDLISDDESLIDRFKSEIRLARMISHPTVVRTHDFGIWNGFYYLTMEYVEGVTARQLIDKQGRLGVPSTLAIATQLARSLEVAHAQGVIHRDIKPQNLLLDKEGTLKVLDFGVACLTERSTHLTQKGMIVGTPAYMAPEQLLEEGVEERSDLYAVGVVLYECLTGQLPFRAATAIALIAKQLSETPTPADRLNPDVPPELSALIGRLLSKAPEGRPASAAELGQLLAQVS